MQMINSFPTTNTEKTKHNCHSQKIYMLSDLLMTVHVNKQSHYQQILYTSYVHMHHTSFSSQQQKHKLSLLLFKRIILSKVPYYFGVIIPRHLIIIIIIFTAVFARCTQQTVCKISQYTVKVNSYTQHCNMYIVNSYR